LIVIIAYIYLFNIDLNILLNIEIEYVALASIVYTIAWFVSAVRLKIIFERVTGKQLSLKDYLLARFIGSLIANLTPSSLGGEPGRSLVLSRKSGVEFAKTLAITTYEDFFDVILPNLIVLFLAVFKLPLTIPLLLISSLLISGSFLFITGITTDMGSKSRLRRIATYIDSKIPSKIKASIRTFRDTLKYFRNNNDRGFMVKLLVLTLLYHVLSALTIYILVLPIYLKHIADSLAYVDVFTTSIMAYFFSYVAGVVPTPGGAIAVEYGLTITLDPVAVVIVRVFMYAYIVVLGGMSFLSLPRMKSSSKR